MGCKKGCQGFKYFSRQEDGDCSCGDVYGKWGPADSCQDCNDWKSDFIGWYSQCVYGYTDTPDTTTTTTTKQQKKPEPEPEPEPEDEPEDEDCPSSCNAPKCISGGSHNGGIKLANGGRCLHWCSRDYAGQRFCGKSGSYKGHGSVDCTKCVEEVCPKGCSKPKCIAGDMTNGGKELNGNTCIHTCSRWYQPPGVRYCGTGEKYDTDDGFIDCSGCKEEASLLHSHQRSSNASMMSLLHRH